MVASSRDSINQRITLTGDDDVRRKLEAIGATGDRAFSSVGRSGRQLRESLQNLSFQVNDLVTSFASGAPVMQVFAQQGGQIFQAFQQGGGLSAVLGSVASRLKEMITPMRVVGGLAAATAAGFGVLLLRAESAEGAMRQFGVVLKGLQKTLLPPALRGGEPATLKGIGVTAESLEKSAQSLRSAGFSINDARQKLLDAVRAGIDPAKAEQVIRIGRDLNAVLGDKAADEFVKAIQGGVPALREFAEKLGIARKGLSGAQDGLNTIPALVKAIGDSVKGADAATLNPLEKRLREINVQWNDLLNTGARFAKEGFVNFIDTGNAAVTLFKSLNETIRRGDFAGLAAGLNAAIEPLKNVSSTLFEANLEAWRGFFKSLPGVALSAFKAGLAELASADPLGLSALAAASIANVQRLFQSAGQLAIDTLVNAFSTADPFAPLIERARSAAAAIQAIFQGILDAANRVASAISSAVSAGGASGFGPGGFAAGTMSTPPGTILVGERGPELISQPGGLRVWPNPQTERILSAFNSLNTPLLPGSRRFAAGTVGAAVGGDAAAAHFHFGDGTSGTMRGSRSVLDALVKEAKSAQMLSAGRRPGAVGGRRYGG